MQTKYDETKGEHLRKRVSQQKMTPYPDAKPFGADLRMGDLDSMGIVEATHEEIVAFFGPDYATDASVYADFGDYPADENGGALPP